jgi:hypothetical protein
LHYVKPLMRSWHDYHLVGYSVAESGRKIAFEVTWPYETETDVRRANVVFSNVEGYFFEHDLGGNILYSISEESVHALLTQNASRFQDESKWGWPLFWRDGVEKTLELLVEKNVKCFEISSSYGLSGWVLATNMDSYETVV